MRPDIYIAIGCVISLAVLYITTFILERKDAGSLKEGGAKRSHR